MRALSKCETFYKFSRNLYRCSLAGRDLNRNYKSVLKDSFPSIWHAKMMIKRLNAERQVVVYCDLHGHSRKNNIFIYGCENKHDRSKRLQERVSTLLSNWVHILRGFLVSAISRYLALLVDRL